MAGNRNMMTKIKRAISPLKPRHEAADPSTTAEHTPLTRYVMDKLTGPSKELFALSFAVQMKVDKHALVFDLADCLPWIGISRIDNAVRLLTKHFTEGQYRVETIFLPREENSSGRGRRPVRHLISLDILEDLMMQAETEQGRNARAMYKQLRDAVQDYMQIEMEAASRAATEREKQAQQQLEEQTSRLAIEEGKRLELENAQKQLHAALQAEKERRASLNALRDAEDEPRQTAYLMESGVYSTYVKIGKTGEEGEKRKKELQTGNPEEITVFFEVKCIDSRLVERNLHHMFRWYKRRGEWFEIDKERAVFYMQLVADLLDKTRKIEHENVDVFEACQSILDAHGLTTSVTGTQRPIQHEEESDAHSPPVTILQTVEDADPYAEYRENTLEQCSRGVWLQWSDLLQHFRGWHDDHFPISMLSEKGRDVTAIKEYFTQKLGGFTQTSRIVENEQGKKVRYNIYGFLGWRFCSAPPTPNSPSPLDQEGGGEELDPNT